MPDQPLARRLRRLQSSTVRDLLRLASRPGMLSLAGGLPAPELFDTEGLQAATASALADDPVACLQYGPTEGQPRLREALARLMRARGVDAGAHDVLVTAGSQQGLDLVARCLLDPGDTVAVEDPTYLAALQVFSLAEAELLPVPGDAAGMQVEALLELPRSRLPRLVYLVPEFANPTGASLSLPRRRMLLEWAAANGVLVLEDDPYGALRSRGEALPPLAAMARDLPGAAGCCGYASTLSKTVAPGLRVGWLVLPPLLAEAVTRAKQAMDLHTATFSQEICARYLESGRLDGHLPRIRSAYSRRRDVLAEALCETFGERLSFQVPDGGMFLWARFTDGTDTRRLLAAALAEGVGFVPGDAFQPRPGRRDRLRLNWTGHDEKGLREAVARLARAHAAAAAIPA